MKREKGMAVSKKEERIKKGLTKRVKCPG